MNNNLDSLVELFNRQTAFQKVILGEPVCDNPKMVAYYIAFMVEELGEVLAVDKRWKTFRNETYSRDEKLKELTDVFIIAINLVLWSGFNGEDIIKEIDKKLNENYERLK